MHSNLNRIFKVIWCRVRLTWVAVSEAAGGQGKVQSSTRRSNRAAADAQPLATENSPANTLALWDGDHLRLVPAQAQQPMGTRRWLAQTLQRTLRALNTPRTLLASALASGSAMAAQPAANQLPTGGQVSAGQASIGQNGANMVINQSTDRAAINWNTFNVGSQAQVQFNQPSAASVTLNRVMSSDPSQIFGRITANGQVILTNPSGVYFGPSARVDVGGLVATTMGMNDADFMAGSNSYQRNGSTASVVNEGELKAALGGYIALLAPEVRNQGAIIAQMGTVALASGEAIDLKFDSNNRLTSLRVDPSQIAALVDNQHAVQAPDGLIIISALSMDRLAGSVVKNSGNLEANSLTAKGGRIVLEADHIELQGAGRIDASGATGGGTVLVGGDWQGGADPSSSIFPSSLRTEGEAIHQATTVTMAQGASIDASATQQGDGGKVVLWSDVNSASSVTEAHGTILAKGGAQGGNGGQVETSGHTLNSEGAFVNAGAPKGTGGLWLLDPSDSTVTQTIADGYQATLNTGTSVANVVTGTIDINDGVTISKTAGGDATLTFSATDRIAARTGSTPGNYTITSSSGKLNVVLRAESDGGTDYGVDVGSITTNGGNLWVGGGTNATWNGLAVGNGAAYGGTSGANNNAVGLKGDITTAGGDVLIAGYTKTNLTNYGDIAAIGATRTIDAGTGNINLLAYHSDYDSTVGNYKINLNTTGKLTLAPVSGQDWYWSNFIWNGTTSGNDFVGSDSASGLVINNLASLGGLTLGTYQGTGLAGDTAYVASNTKNTTVASAININGPVKLYGGLVDVYGDITTNNHDIFIQAIDHSASTGGIRLSSGGRSTTLNSGSSNITLQADQIAFDGLLSSSNTATTSITSTGVLTIRPDSSAFTTNMLTGSNGATSNSTLNWNGSLSGTTWIGSTSSSATNDFYGLRINNFANLGGLVLQKEGVTTPVSIDTATTIAGPIAVYGIAVNVNANLSSTNGAVLLKASGGITQASNVSVTTNGGDVTYWSDSDGSNGGYVWFQSGSSVNTTTAGNIVVSGGNVSSADLATLGSAVGMTSTMGNGVTLDAVTMSSHGGNITIRGTSTTSAASAYNSSDYNNVMNANGIRTHGSITLDSGSGLLNLWGYSQGTGSTSASNGFESSQTGNSVYKSSSTASNAITITGTATSTSTANSWGVYLRSTDQVLATNGGGISITGSGAKQSGVYVGSNVLSTGGPITLTGTGYGSGNYAVEVSGTVGKKTGTSVTSSSSNIDIVANTLNLTGTLDATGTLTVEPYGNSFASALTWPFSGLTVGTGFTGLTIGKSGNTADITIGSATSIAGPITVYGGAINLSANLSTTAATGTGVLLQGTKILQNASVGVSTSGSDITYSVTNSPSTSVSDYGIRLYGTTSTSKATIDAGGGNISLSASYATSGTAGGSDRAIELDFASIKTRGAGSITLTGDASNTPTTTSAFGIGFNTATTSATTLIQSENGAINITGTPGKTSSTAYGIYNSNNALSILSATGAITLNDIRPDSLPVTTYGGLFLRPYVSPNNLFIGSDGTTVLTGTSTSSSSNVTINADKVTFQQQSGNVTQINTSGTVTIRPNSADFGSPLDTTYLALASTVSGLTIGKSDTSADGTADAAVTIGRATSIAGPITVYGGAINLSANLSTTAATGTGVSITASTKITQNAGVQVTTSGANISYQATTLTATSGNDIGIQIGESSNTARAVIAAGGGNITLNGGYASSGGVSGGSDRAIILFDSDITTTGASTITLTGDASNNVNTGNTWGIQLGNTRVQTETGNITLTGTGGKPSANSRGIASAPASAKILSNSGAIQLIDQKPAGLTGTYYGMYLQPGTGNLILGADGTNVSSSTSPITIQADTVSFVVNGSYKPVVSTSGAVVVESVGASFAAALDTTALNIAGTPSSVRLGKDSNTANITVGSVIPASGPISIYGGDITINAGLVSTSDTGVITLKGSGNVTDGTNGYVQAGSQTTMGQRTGSLLLLGGNVTLDNSANNDVGTMAASGVGGLTYLDYAGLIVSTVGSTSGVTATGVVNIGTKLYSLAVEKDITTTSTSANALTLNASIDSAVGADLSSNVLIRGNSSYTPTISVGSGGIGRIYTGGITSDSQRVSQLSALTAGQFRYNSDETTTNYTTALSSGIYAIYRQQPSATATVANKSMTYGDALPVLTGSVSGAVNGDSASYGVSNRVNSASGNIKAGSYTLTETGLAGLGYSVSATTGTLTVATKALSLTGLLASDKTYDRSTTASISSYGTLSGLMGSDAATLVSSSASAAFGDWNAGTNKTVTVSGLSLSGNDAANYSLGSQTTTATINPKALTLTAATGSKVYDGSTTSSGTVSYSGLVTGDVLFGQTQSYDSKNVQGTNGSTLSVNSGYTLVDGNYGNNYAVTLVSAAGTITPKALTLAGATGVSKTYDGTSSTSGVVDSNNAAVAAMGSLGGIVSGDTVTTSGAPVFASANVARVGGVVSGAVTTQAIQQGTVVLSGADAGNYSLSWTNGSGKINPAALVVTANNDAKFVTMADPTFTLSYSGFVNGESSSVLSSTPTVSVDRSNTLNITNGSASTGRLAASGSEAAGTYANALVASGAAAYNYSISYVKGSYTIVPADQLLVRVNSASTTYGTDASYSLSSVKYVGTTGQATFTVSGLGMNGSITGLTITNGANKFVVGDQLSLTGGSGNSALASVTSVSNGVITGVNISNGGAFYAPGDVLTAQYTREVSVGSTVTGSSVALNDSAGTTASFSLTPQNAVNSTAGLLKVGAYQLGGASLNVTGSNFSGMTVVGDLTVNQKALTAVVNTSAKTKTYDGTAAMLGLNLDATAAGVVTNDLVSLSGSGAFSNKNVSRDGSNALAANKSYTVSGISLSGDDAGNYYLSSTSVTGSDGQITPKTLTVSYTGVDKVYDGTSTATVTTSDNRITGDNLSIARTASFVSTDSEAAKSVVRDGNGDVVAKNISVSSVSLSGTDALNYALASSTGSATAKITPASLVISGIVGVDKTYDKNTAAVLSTSGLLKTGLITNDVVTVTATGVYADYNAGLSKTITLSSTYGGADVGNYTITGQTSTTASIDKRQVTVSASGGISKVYDGTTDMNGVNITVGVVSGVSASGVIDGDTVSVSGTGSFSSANAGTGKSYTLADLQLSGASVSNYMIVGGATSITGNDGVITQKTLTLLGFDASDKVYDGTNVATILNAGTLNGIVGSDSVTVSNTGATFSDQNAATGKTVTLHGLTLGGTDVGNYTLDTAAVTDVANITAKTLTITGLSANNGTYNGTTAASISNWGTVDTGISGENLTLNHGSASFDNANAGTGKTVTASGYTLADGTGSSGGLASNYQLSSASATTTADMAKASLSISTSDVTKTYDGGTSAAGTATVVLGTLYTNVSNGNTQDSISGGSFAFTDKNAGTGNKTVTTTGVTVSDGNSGSNYDVTYVDNTTSTINKATLTVTGSSAANKTYDGATTASITVGTLSGFVGSEVVTATANGTFNSKDAGSRTATAVYTLADDTGTSGGLAANYQLANTTHSATIDKATLTVSGSSAANKTYDGATTASITVGTLSGFVGSEVVTATANGTFNSKDAGSRTATAVYTLADDTGTSGGLAANYQLANTTHSATIDKATLTVSGSSAANKTYDGATTASITVGTLSGFVGSEVVTATANGTFDSPNAGSRTATAVYSLADDTGTSGGLAANYQLANTTHSATIDKATLTVTGTSVANKVYDGTTTASLSGGTLVGVVGSEDVTLTQAGTFVDKNVGTAKAVTAADTLGGTAMGNYVLVQPTALSADITPKALTISGLTSSNKVYDGTTTAAVNGTAALQTFQSAGSGTSSDGVAYSGDMVSLTGTAIGTFNSKDVASANTVAFTGLSLSGSDAGNYTLTQHANGTSARITPASLMVTVNNDVRFVSQTDTAGFAGVGYTGFVNGETTSALGGTLAITRSNASTSTVGSYSGVLQASGLTAANYNISYVPGNYTIVGSDQLLVRVNNLTSTYGAAAQYAIASVEYFDGNHIIRLDNGSVNNSSVTITPGNQVVVNDGANGTASFTLAPVAAALSTAGKLSVGSYQLGTSGAVTENSQNFNNTITVVGSQQVAPKAVTASATGVSKVYDGDTSVTNATLGLASVESGDVLSVSGLGTYAGKNAGSGLGYTFSSVALSGTDAGNYYLSGGNSFTGSNGNITPKMVSLSASKTYDGVTALTGSQVTIGGLINSETLSYTGATSNDAHVATFGKYINAITLADAVDGSGGLAANYQLPTLDATNAAVSIRARTLTPTLSNTGVSKVYDGTTNAPRSFVPTYSFSGLASGDTAASLSYASATYNNANVASANTLTLAGLLLDGITGSNNSVASDYVLDSTAKSVAASITKANLTVQANNDARFVSQTDMAGYTGVTYSGFVNGETSSALGGTLAMTRTDAGNSTAGVHSNVLQASGLMAANYNLNYVNGNYTIVGANELLVRVANVSDTYGTATQYGIASVQYESGGVVYTLGTAGNVSGSSVAINASNVVSINDGAGGTASFTLAPVSAVLSTAGKLSVGSYQLGTSGTVTENSANFNNTVTVLGGHQVNAKAVTASANGVSKVYDGNTTVTNGTLALSGHVTGDNLSVSGMGSYASKNAGTTSYSYANVALSGTDAGNYYLSGGNSFTGSDGTITPKSLIASYTASNKVYDQSTLASVAGYSNDVVAGDLVSFANTNANFADKNVGTGKSITVGGISIGGTDAGNYSLQNTTANTTANITPKAITVSGIIAADKVYDGNTTASISTAGASGWIAGDNISVIATGTFDNRNVGVDKIVTLSSSYSGNDVGNYTITNQASNTASVTPKAVSLNLTGITKVYDGQVTYTASTSELQTLSTELGVSGDSVANALLTLDNKNVGTGKSAAMTSVTLNDGNNGQNYTVTLGSNSNSSVTRLNSVTWVGGSTGNWFDPANWAGGAVPDLSNVANVVIPAGVTVNFDTTAALGAAVSSSAVNLDSLGSAGALNQLDGSLNIGAGGTTLAALAQSGGNLTVGGDMTINGSVQQSGSGHVSVQGQTHIAAPGQDVVLANAGNDFVGLVTVTAANVALTDVNALTAVLTTSGNSTLTAGGNLAVSGTAQDLTLDAGGATSFGTTTVGGNLLSTTHGAGTSGGVIQTGALVVHGTSTFVADTGTLQDAALTNPANDFVGAVSFTTTHGGSWRNVALTDANDLTLGNVTITGDLTLTNTGTLDLGTTTIGGDLNANSHNGNIIQSGPLHVTGDTTLDAGSGDITLNNANNDFGGVFNADAHNITINDINSLTLGDINASGNLDATANQNITINGHVDANSLDLTATHGNISQTNGGTLVVTNGPSNLDAGGDIALGGSNDFNGSVNAHGGNITINDINSLTLGDINASGNLDATANQNITINGHVDANSLDLTATHGDISQTNGGTLVVANGPSNLNAGGDITLGGSNDFNGSVNAHGGNITINDINSLTLGDINATNRFDVTAGGNISQDSSNGKKIVVGGLTHITTPGDVVLDGPANQMPQGAVIQARSARVVGDSRKATADAQAKVNGSAPTRSMPGTGLSNTAIPQPLVLVAEASSTSTSSSNAVAGAASSSVNSAGVTVDVHNLHQESVPLMVAVSLPKGASTVGTGFTFELPESVQSMPGARESMELTQMDGNTLPAWLKFDQALMRFEASAVPNSSLPMQLKALVGGQRVTVVISERTE